MKEQTDIAKVLEGEHKPRSWRRWKLWIIAVGLVTAVVAASVFFSGTIKQATQYKTQVVMKGDLTIIVTATGTLEPTKEVDVGSEISGIIKSVAVDYNDSVKAGQVLAVIDTTKIEAQVTQSRAALQAAQAKVQQTRATVSETHDKLDQYLSVRKLSNNKVPSQTEMTAAQAAFDRAKADEASAEAEVSQAKATLQANLTDLSKAVIRAPSKGVILTRKVEPGQTVAASFETPVLFSMAEDLTQMELHVNVDEADVGKVRIGQEATFTVSAYPNRKFAARIIKSYYGSSTTSGVVTYETVLKVDNSDLSLRPGMTVTSDIKVQEEKNVLLVPSAALRFTPEVQENTDKRPSNGVFGSLLPHPPEPQSNQNHNDSKQQKVWILENGQLRSIPVSVGATNGSLTEIKNGDLKPGMAVVTEAVSTEP
jgi:HlyD family secretion protein